MARIGTTRWVSGKQEAYIAKLLGAKQTVNSGAAHYNCGDIISEDWLFEAKSTLSEKKSFSIKKEWLEKNERERKDAQKSYSSLVFQFAPDGENYFVVPEKTFKIMYEVFNSYGKDNN